jgi:rRNA N6-adenosine-methyltransferase METTL5
MKLREIESQLSGVNAFENPNVELEQYPTSSHLAAQLLHVAQSRYGDIAERVVLDLGCGAGVLSVGAALCEAAHVLAVDIDASALAIAADNARTFHVSETIDLMLVDVLDLLPNRIIVNSVRKVDTVIMNPPFGTKRKGIDMAFLQVALTYATGAVYSLHKSSTRDYIDRKARSWGVRPELVAQLRFDIPQMYSFHKLKAVDVDVDLWRFDVSLLSNNVLLNCNPDANVALNPSVPTPCAATRGRHRKRTGFKR